VSRTGAGEGGSLTRAELRSLFLFQSLSDEQLDWLAEHGHIEQRAAGAMVYTEGEPADDFFVVLEGSVALLRRVRSDDIEVSRTDQRGVYGGAVQAYIREAAPPLYPNSMRALTDVQLFVLAAADFAHMVRDWFPMAIDLLEGLFFGLRSTQAATGQREHLLALGSLSAGLAHELNNPAAAAMRAAGALREHVGGMRRKLRRLASGDLDRESLSTLVDLQRSLIDEMAGAPKLSAREAAEREDEVGAWLEDRGVPTAWDVAPVFAGAGVGTACLEDIASSVPPTLLDTAMQWMADTVETEQLLGEMDDSLRRISNLVGAARQYSQMDRAPEQVVDVRELLDSTLVMFGGKLPTGVRVVKDYAPSLPSILAYGAELNQVWTNLIHNALDAMGDEGTLGVRVYAEDGSVVVEIADTGPGIAPDVEARIFEPFFTTKPVGQGTGLGLDISWRIVVNRHHGDLTVTSVPGDTRFRVRLPVERPPT
jgi:signal transduction histidine kinase